MGYKAYIDQAKVDCDTADMYTDAARTTEAGLRYSRAQASAMLAVAEAIDRLTDTIETLTRKGQ